MHVPERRGEPSAMVLVLRLLLVGGLLAAAALPSIALGAFARTPPSECVRVDGRAGFVPCEDEDGDALADVEERRLGADPARADSDGDGLVDGEEVVLRTDPARADSDGGGVDDGQEVEDGTAPTDAADDGAPAVCFDAAGAPAACPP